MTVKELIKLLEKVDQNLVVLVAEYTEDDINHYDILDVSNYESTKLTTGHVQLNIS